MSTHTAPVDAPSTGLSLYGGRVAAESSLKGASPVARQFDTTTIHHRQRGRASPRAAAQLAHAVLRTRRRCVRHRRPAPRCCREPAKTKKYARAELARRGAQRAAWRGGSRVPADTENKSKSAGEKRQCSTQDEQSKKPRQRRRQNLVGGGRERKR